MARLFEPEPGGSTIFVTFPSLDPDQNLDKTGFAENWFRTDQINCVIVTCATNEWFQYEDWPAMLAAIKARCAGHQIITFGASMGGYGALFASTALQASKTITVSPMYSFHQDKVPYDGRFHRIRKNIAVLFDDPDKEISQSAAHYTFFDPTHRRDLLHSKRIGDCVALNKIVVPFGGHSCTEIIQHGGFWRSAVQDIASGQFCARRFRSSYRTARSSNPVYWQRLSAFCAQRGMHHLAARAKALACAA